MSATSDPSPAPRKGLMEGVNRPVFFWAAGITAVFVLAGIVAPGASAAFFSTLQAWIVADFGWFYLLSVAIFLLFMLLLGFTGHGRVKLGPNHSEPDYSYGAWFSMLFAAGMGIGLVFFGVAEPIKHFTTPPVGDPATVEAARTAMQISYFHWGLHAWAVYAVIGLSLAYFSYRHGLPLTMRSALYPIIGERIHGPIGHAVDIFATIGTLFGVATSLGLGVLQVNAGFNHVMGWPIAFWVQLPLIAVITAMATISVATGLDKGIKFLSNLNMVMASALMLFIFVVGPTTFLLRAFVQNLGAYLDQFILRTFYMYAYAPNDVPAEWLGDWTLFYWGWWVAWSPFVGMFIARISRGRTIREFVMGVLLVPAGFSFAWMTVFGDAAIFLHLYQGNTAVSDAVARDVTLALFVFLEQYPLGTYVSWFAMALIVFFFVTGADSSALVIDTITSGGREDGPVWRRVFWAILGGVIAAVLLSTGGLDALQTASIASALPFTMVMLVMCWGLWRGLQREGLRQDALAQSLRPRQGLSWQRQLHGILAHPRRPEAERFLRDTAQPVLEAVAAELRQRGLEAEVTVREDRLHLTAMPGSPEEFQYGVRLRRYETPSYAYMEREKDHEHFFRAEVFLETGGQDYDVMGFTRDELMQDVLQQYDRHFQYLHAVRAG
ncbi:BCCT family transporter [Pseudoroseomonas ludipueritiae]|uniref:BCCT family transporter n=1 Tax=Pseudoroseomonas ludipueritiae TaxID=198093 RepID=A0ABR7R9L2_9PROT|nr:BCCT family transporter [Pseudoroseomonas ludipueritiae]MBC9178496.1 BCCT family transporter [Pseudoroseomonas ludipueritiae]MCG7361862.1 BCCT family transporter [Roseomonas sp. ACRSG]